VVRKNSMKSFLNTLTICFVFILTFSCGDKGEQEKGTVTVPKKAALTNMTSKPAVFTSISSKIANLPKFDFYKVKDPFFSPIVQQSVKQTKGGVTAKNLKPTQKFEIDKYKLLGVMIDKRAKAAIFEDPDGKGWVLKEGMQIGSEGFRIKKITADGVVAEEVVTDASGKKKSSEIFISIKKIR